MNPDLDKGESESSNPTEMSDDQNQAETWVRKYAFPVGGGIIALLAIWGIGGLLLLNCVPSEKVGQFGDWFGPMNAFLSSLAVVLALAAVFYQRDDLKAAINEQKRSGNAQQALARLEAMSSLLNSSREEERILHAQARENWTTSFRCAQRAQGLSRTSNRGTLLDMMSAEDDPEIYKILSAAHNSGISDYGIVRKKVMADLAELENLMHLGWSEQNAQLLEAIKKRERLESQIRHELTKNPSAS